MSSTQSLHLVFALEYPIAYGGGVSVLVRELIRGLGRDCRISLVSPDTPADLEQAGLAGALEHHLFWQTERASRQRAHELSARIAEWGPSLVHFHCGGNYGWGNRRPGTSPIPFLARRGIACLTTSHLIVSILHSAIDPASPWWLHAAALPVAWLGRLAVLRSSAAEIAVSDHDLGHLCRWYWPYRSRFHRIYHSRLSETPPPSRPISQRSPVILHVGHRAHRKGQHFLVQAFAAVAHQHPAYRLVLVGPPGDDAFERELSACVELHGLQHRVEIKGPRDDVSALMQDAAVYVQPSLQEALGLALQEALFYGCACIGAAVGGIPEMIDDGENGLLVPAGDAACLASALNRMLGDDALRERCSSSSPASIRRRGMSSPEMIRRHRTLYHEILGACAAFP